MHARLYPRSLALVPNAGAADNQNARAQAAQIIHTWAYTLEWMIFSCVGMGRVLQQGIGYFRESKGRLGYGAWLQCAVRSVKES